MKNQNYISNELLSALTLEERNCYHIVLHVCVDIECKPSDYIMSILDSCEISKNYRRVLNEFLGILKG